MIVTCGAAVQVLVKLLAAAGECGSLSRHTVDVLADTVHCTLYTADRGGNFGLGWLLGLPPGVKLLQREAEQ